MASALLIGSPEPHDPGERSLRAALAESLPEHDLRVAAHDPRRLAEAEGLVGIDAASPRALLDAVRGSDLVVALGDPVGSGAAGAAALLLAASSPGCRLALLAVTATRPPHRGGRRLLCRLLASSELCVVADRDSALALRACGAPAPLRIGADPAWGAVPPLPFPGPPTNGDRRRSRLVVACDGRDAGRTGHLRVAAALQPLTGSALYEIELQPWLVRAGGADDVEVAHAVAAALGPDARVGMPPADLAEARDRYADADLVVAMGPRPLIAAAAAGTRTVTLSDDRPTRALAERLVQPSSGTDSAAAMSRAVLIALDAQPPLGSAVHEEIDAARETLRLLRVLATEGRTGESEEVRGLALEPEPGS